MVLQFDPFCAGTKFFLRLVMLRCAVELVYVLDRSQHFCCTAHGNRARQRSAGANTHPYSIGISGKSGFAICATMNIGPRGECARVRSSMSLDSFPDAPETRRARLGGVHIFGADIRGHQRGAGLLDLGSRQAGPGYRGCKGLRGPWRPGSLHLGHC